MMQQQQQSLQPRTRTRVVQAPPPKREERRASSGVMAAGRRVNCDEEWGERGSEQGQGRERRDILNNPLPEILPLIGYGKN